VENRTDPVAGDTPRGLHEPLRFLQRFFTFMADSSSRFGFVAFAETWNGRLAMLGFVIGLSTELLTGQGILSQIGLG
jgi:ferrochelatase